MVYNVHNGNNYELYMDRQNGSSAAANTWASTTPTSTVWSVATDDNNASSQTYISYVFTDIQGYSKFGVYKGNGNADGAFVYTGFKPAFLIAKLTSGGGQNWFMFDNKRNTFNAMDKYLYCGESDTEGTADRVDFLSNGFKWRTNSAGLNGSGNSYIYIAFAESTLVNSNGVPCNGR